MVLRGSNSKDTVSDRNSNAFGSLILENFRGNWFSPITNFEKSVQTNFRESPILKITRELVFAKRHFGVEKGI